MRHKRLCGVAEVLLCVSDSQVGVLRVWNVSRSTPLDSFKLKKTGFHALHVLNSPLAKKGKLNWKKINDNVTLTDLLYWFHIQLGCPLSKKQNLLSSFSPQLRVLALRVKVSTRVPPVRLCLRPRCHRTSPSHCPLARPFAASWTEASDSTTWAPKSGTSSETWYCTNHQWNPSVIPSKMNWLMFRGCASLWFGSLSCFPGSRRDDLWL